MSDPIQKLLEEQIALDYHHKRMTEQIDKWQQEMKRTAKITDALASTVLTLIWLIIVVLFIKATTPEPSDWQSVLFWMSMFFGIFSINLLFRSESMSEAAVREGK